MLLIVQKKNYFSSKIELLVFQIQPNTGFMNITKICLIITLSISSFIAAQSKKNLIEELSQLKQELKSTKGDLNESRKNESVNNTRVKSMEAQVADLKDSNASLLAKPELINVI